jgi:hypothetical protein
MEQLYTLMLAIALRLLSLMLLAIALHSSSLLLATDLRSVYAIVFTLTHGNICFSNMTHGIPQIDQSQSPRQGRHRPSRPPPAIKSVDRSPLTRCRQAARCSSGRRCVAHLEQHSAGIWLAFGCGTAIAPKQHVIRAHAWSCEEVDGIMRNYLRPPWSSRSNKTPAQHRVTLAARSLARRCGGLHKYIKAPTR